MLQPERESVRNKSNIEKNAPKIGEKKLNFLSIEIKLEPFYGIKIDCLTWYIQQTFTSELWYSNFSSVTEIPVEHLWFVLPFLVVLRRRTLSKSSMAADMHPDRILVSGGCQLFSYVPRVHKLPGP